MKHVDYHELEKSIVSLCENETDDVALMATVACEVHHSDDRFNWTGFYRVLQPNLLKVGPYQGGHGCLTIPYGRGVCGKVARTQRPQLVDDVNSFEGHIACASSTQSELVLPVFNNVKELIAVFDIDSDQPAAFCEEDLQALSDILNKVFCK